MKSDDHGGRNEWIRRALERYERPLVRYADHILRDTDRARDVVQDTFLRLCAAERAEVEDHVGPWLFTVCRNRALDIQRKERRMSPLSDDHLDNCASHDPSPVATLEGEEAAGHVLRALESLPEKQQEVIRLKFQEGFSYRDISRVTGHSVSNVGFLIHAAIRTLRRELADLSPSA